MAEIIFELIGGWSQHGPEKGISGKIRHWLLIALMLVFLCLLVAVYLANLKTMNLGLAIGLPLLTILFGGIIMIYFYAIRRKAREKD